MKIQPAIMSGGAGTRLWPMSRAANPKQFLPLVSDASLFQETVSRLSGDGPVEFLAPIVIAGAAHVRLIEDQLRAIGVTPAAIIIEPMARNTAAVAAVASAWTARYATGAMTLLAPADHHIADAAQFRQAVAHGAAIASKGAIVTFGVQPTEPHTGYGYIEAGATIGPMVYEVSAFAEKPNRQTAETYVAGGRHFWNAGIFLFSPDTMLSELSCYAPEIMQDAVSSFDGAVIKDRIFHLDAVRFGKCPSDSIDYAVMEKTKRAAVVAPVDAGWSDIGAWTSLAAKADDKRITSIDCEATIIRTDGPFVGAIGVSDLIIIATGDAVLVAPKSRAQDVKKIIEELKARGREDLL